MQIDKELEFTTEILTKKDASKIRNLISKSTQSENHQIQQNPSLNFQPVTNLPTSNQPKHREEKKSLAIPIPNPIIQPVLSKSFKNEKEWSVFADELFQKEDYHNALMAYRNVIQLNTQNIDAWISSGVSFNNKGDFRRSIRAFKQALAISAKHSQLWMYLGIGFYNTGDYEQAVNSLNECLELEPENELAKKYLNQIPKKYKKELDMMKRQAEQLALHAQNVEDQLFDQLNAYSKAYHEISYDDLLPLVFNEPYITDLPSLQHKIRDLVLQNRINVKMFLDHLEFESQKQESKEKIVIQIDKRFNVKKLLAFTNFSQLWLAEDLKTRQLYVLKHIIFRGDYTHRKLIEHMALREITLLSKIKSSNIIQLVDSFLGEYQDNFGYILQEPFYIHGTLDRKIKSLAESKKLVEPLAILTILDGLLRAIISVHEVGIVHRDIKPSNIIIKTKSPVPHPDDIILIDFGIATAPKEISGTDFTIVGGCGTSGFSAPEQLNSPHVGYNADIYAIGATIYFAMTFSKYNISNTFQIPPVIKQYYSSIEFIFPLLERMLDKKPDNRNNGITELYQIEQNLQLKIHQFVKK